MTGAIADPPPQHDEIAPPPVPQDVEDGSLPQNYSETDFLWYRLYLNSQFPPRRTNDPPPQE